MPREPEPGFGLEFAALGKWNTVTCHVGVGWRSRLTSQNPNLRDGYADSKSEAKALAMAGKLMSSVIGYFDDVTVLEKPYQWSSLTLVPARVRVRLKRRTVASDIIWVSDGTSADTILDCDKVENSKRLDMALLVARSVLLGGRPRLFLGEGSDTPEIYFEEQIFVSLLDWALVGAAVSIDGATQYNQGALISLLAKNGYDSIISVKGTGPFPALS